jgi:putative DNA primase/helicase
MSTTASAARLPASSEDAATTDEALALRFTDRLACEARYVAAWHRWMLYDGVVWRPDDTLQVFDEARAIRREAGEESRDPRAKARIGSAVTVAAIERLARADRRHAASVEQWDADPWLLNTPDGAIDLRTGQERGHLWDDYITQVTAVAPGGDCPQFRAFLAHIFKGDDALIGFVQRALGYALTGDISEHALFFAYGTGGNGKGVLLNTIAGILGGYAAVAPMDAFTVADHERHPTELAMLRGARFVIAQETEAGRRWNEPRIKSLTGGDPITARTMRSDFFTYRPRFKLFIAGNHKPTIGCVDEAMRRRLTLIPFDVTIPAAEADRNLSRKLEAEWPGILAWLIAGCRAWQRDGLAPPAAIADATADYLAEEDTFGAWLAEWVRPAAEEATETSANLFSSWETFATWAQEPAGSRKAFMRAMRARGFTPCRIGHAGARGFQGLTLRRHSDAAVMMAAMSGQQMPVEGL